MQGIIIITTIALISSILLVYLDNYLNKPNKKIETINSMLPGYNCGGCGYAGCKEMAEALLKNKEELKKCRPLRGEKKENLEKYLNENVK